MSEPHLQVLTALSFMILEAAVHFLGLTGMTRHFQEKFIHLLDQAVVSFLGAAINRDPQNSWPACGCDHEIMLS